MNNFLQQRTCLPNPVSETRCLIRFYEKFFRDGYQGQFFSQYDFPLRIKQIDTHTHTREIF